jgi:hypothetical protein
MEVPFCLVEFRAGRKRYLRWLFGDGKTRGQLGTCGAVYRLPLWRMGRCVLPSLRQKRVLRFCPDVDAPVRQVEVQWSVSSSPRRSPVASTKEKNARSRSSHLATNFCNSVSA